MLIRKLNDAILFQPQIKDENGETEEISEFDESEFIVKNHNNNTDLGMKQIKVKSVDRFLIYTMNNTLFNKIEKKKYLKHSIDDIDEPD